MEKNLRHVRKLFSTCFFEVFSIAYENNV